jgi:hypothetical protein
MTHEASGIRVEQDELKQSDILITRARSIATKNPQLGQQHLVNTSSRGTTPHLNACLPVDS